MYLNTMYLNTAQLCTLHELRNELCGIRFLEDILNISVIELLYFLV